MLSRGCFAGERRAALFSSHVLKAGRGMEPEGAEAESSTGGRDGCGKCEEITKGSQDEDKHGATAGAQVRDGRR